MSRLFTGQGNFWSRVLVTSLRHRNGIDCHDAQRQTEQGWINLSQAAQFAWPCLCQEEVVELAQLCREHGCTHRKDRTTAGSPVEASSSQMLRRFRPAFDTLWRMPSGRGSNQFLAQRSEQFTHPEYGGVAVFMFVPLNDLYYRRDRHWAVQDSQWPVPGHESRESPLHGCNPRGANDQLRSEAEARSSNLSAPLVAKRVE